MKFKIKPQRSYQFQYLIRYLNLQWNAWRQEMVARGRSSAYIKAEWKKFVAAVTELRNDVQRLLNPPTIPGEAPESFFPNSKPGDKVTPTEYWLEEILKKLDAIEPTFFTGPARVFTRVPSPTFCEGSPILTLGDEKFSIAKVPWPEDYTIASLYFCLDGSLMSGEFSLLRQCPACFKYFAAERAKKRCCSRRCNTRYQNERRIAGGYYRGKPRKLREHARRRREGKKR